MHAMIVLLYLFSSLFFQAHAQEVKMTMTDTDQSTESIVFGMGCFWGAEKRMSAIKGVIDVESGYAGGDQSHTNYEQVLNLENKIRRGISQQRNHAEVIKVTFDPRRVTLETLLINFWENHNPTQGNRQGNDIGTNYRSAIYTQSKQQTRLAEATKKQYQTALAKAGLSKITTEIAPLRNYIPAEEYHQNYLEKNPNGYCGLGGTGVKYPNTATTTSDTSAVEPAATLSAKNLNNRLQLIVFEAEDCQYCKAFKQEVLSNWQSEVAITTTLVPQPPTDWKLAKPLFATPTIVLFKAGEEVSRFTGYTGDKKRFWQWLGFQLLTPQQQRIAFEQGTEPAFSGSHLDEKRPGTFVDPITGAALFRTDTKFESGSGWPSFFNPVEGAITEHPDHSHGMQRIEVRSASSGIHLGHVFNDGPPPSHKRYCINGDVLKFIAD
ncbi:MAG: peptide methionine sulfoxide reductase [Piscirickettsiaceae bacterium CG_4_9_14_3_um_filter_43_564]|nr:peptide-methionine (S)-S-oxide reductase MsrA [Thiomicrospira sp.]OIP94188.1 MAG: peptide methionine sulfoxide reductase [Thiomicrospira sp. CG2_30_44_34]PIQ05441.1 MAG: peptide methionine sulfoxide reductase [Piscirickettsiaceae bacterium CG18_big_fil_WC_8_21_14_2_50_44_103]PIU38289.1 MAG: peptide methionine sulfoxide reductase [Piscirickettsiaceae bacterium CG07_land_8_20_14_0_80_44_28]PIW57592.1 MAG: peptide methionine sulfoxide reductase [Piscirickettsiaceae bacterium CG12_big_fil_rev_8_